MLRALEVAALGHPEVLDRLLAQLVAEDLAHLVERPHRELALDALGVGVERGGEGALLLAQLGERPVERLAADALEQRLAGDLPGVQVGAREQGVVVEHLLEVRDEPEAVDGVAGEAAADLVVHAAARHPAQRVQRHLALAAPEQELDRRGGRELRRRAEPAVLGVVELAQPGDGGVERGRVDLLLGRLQRGGAAQPLDDAAGLRADLLALLVPGGADRGQHLRPARACPGAARAGSTCRPRTARRRASGRRSAASRPARSSPAPRPCRSRRRPGAPRGRP